MLQRFKLNIFHYVKASNTRRLWLCCYVLVHSEKAFCTISQIGQASHLSIIKQDLTAKELYFFSKHKSLNKSIILSSRNPWVGHVFLVLIVCRNICPFISFSASLFSKETPEPQWSFYCLNIKRIVSPRFSDTIEDFQSHLCWREYFWHLSENMKIKRG